MLKIIASLAEMIFVSFAANAQTIYHYRQIAEVVDGIKTSYKGKYYVHYIISDDSIIHVKEDGEPYCKDKEFWSEGQTTVRVISGNDVNSYDFIGINNGIRVYKHHRILEKTTPNYAIRTVSQKMVDDIKYIYVSSDYSKLNIPSVNSVLNANYIADGKKHERVSVFELYDTDEKGAMPSSENHDLSNPSTLY